jgi:two-component system sensor histidine kinase ArlS
MNIKTKLALRFNIIVLSLLFVFTVSIFVFSSIYRKQEFFSRLKEKAQNLTHLLIDVSEIDMEMLKIIQKGTVGVLPNEKIVIYNMNKKIVYSSTENIDTQFVNWDLIPNLTPTSELEYTINKNEVLVFMHTDKENENYIVVASAFDKYGRSKMNNLGLILIIGFLISTLISFLSSVFYAGQALKPIANINEQVSAISATNLNLRLHEGLSKDEIAQLASNFNRMLERIGKSFEMQRSFVSNASHELRTPLAAITSQVEVGLIKEREPEYYKLILQSILEDVYALTNLTNGLLQLAQSEMDSNEIYFNKLRIDELLFEVKQEVKSRNQHFTINIEFDEMPDNEEDLLIYANAELLKTAIANIIDNGCKYSPDNKVNLSLKAQSKEIIIKVEDHGIGIDKKSLDKIFEPFFRSDKAKAFKGYGIGLPLSKNIIDLHGGKILVVSKPNQSTVFEIIIPNDFRNV